MSTDDTGGVDIADMQVEGPGVWKRKAGMAELRKMHRRKLLVEHVEYLEDILRGPALLSEHRRKLLELTLLVREVLLDP